MTDMGRRAALALHAEDHQDDGDDEISVTGLSGELADDQEAKAHGFAGARHVAATLEALNLKVSDATLDTESATRTPKAHKTSHQDGGDDEISVAGLSGDLADDQEAKAHVFAGARHVAATLEALNLKVSDATLDTESATRTPKAHKTSHQDGGADEIAATGLVGRINYVDRGDPTGFDFTLNDFTTDDTWRDLSLSGIVPAGAIAACCYLVLNDDAVSSYLQFRKKGSSNEYNRSIFFTQVSGINIVNELICFCDTSLVIQYKGSNLTFSSISLVIKGWLI